jgi:hypothetical protein
MADRSTGSFIGKRVTTVTSPPNGIYNIGSTANAEGNWPDDSVSAVFDPYLVTSITGSTGNTSSYTTYSATHSTVASKTGHLLFIQASKDYFTDCQLDKIVVDGTTIWTTDSDSTGWKNSSDYLGYGTSSNHAAWDERYLSSYKANVSSDRYQMMSHLSGLSFYNLITATASGHGNWYVDKGGTPSSLTGSTTDADGSTTGYYIYFEASGTQTQAAVLKSPEITLDSSPNISFAYNRYGSGFAFVQLEVWFVPSF